MATEFADMAQEVEHVLGKDEVTSSNLVISSKKTAAYAAVLLFSLFAFLFFCFSLYVLGRVRKILKVSKDARTGRPFSFYITFTLH